LGGVSFLRAVMLTGHSIQGPVALWIKSNTLPLHAIADDDVAVAVLAHEIYVVLVTSRRHRRTPRA